MDRRYGFLCLLTPVCWTLTVVLLVVGALVGIYSMLLGVSTVLTPSPSDEQDTRNAVVVLVGVTVGAVALALITMVLDTVVSVMSLRRVGGEGRDRVVPVLSLLAAGVSTALPLLLLALALAAGALEQRELAVAVWWLLAGTVAVLAPCTRLAQLIGGIVETVAASRRPGVGPLP